MAEEMDTQNPAPSDGSADSVGHASDETQDTSQGVTEQPTTPSGETSESTSEVPEAPKKEYRYVGKKFADVEGLENAYLSAQQKITELTQAPVQAPVQEQSWLDQPDPAEQRMQVLEKQLAEIRLQRARDAEDKLLDEVLEAHPRLKSERDLMHAYWRANPNKPAEEVVARFEKIVSMGRNENQEDLLKKKKNAVETGKNSTEAPVKTTTKADRFAEAAEYSGKHREPDISKWAAALPDDILKSSQ